MATCGSIQHIFDKPLPEKATLLDSLSSWNQVLSMKPIDDSSFTEIFGELHFKEKYSVPSSISSASSSFSPCLPPLCASSLSSSSSSYSSSSSSLDAINQFGIGRIYNIDDKYERKKSPISNYYPKTSNSSTCSSHKKHYNHSDSFSSRTSESLSICTEGLGFESSDDIEDFMNDSSKENWQQQEEKTRVSRMEYPGNYESKRSRTTKGSFPPPISCIGKSGKPWVCFKSFREDGRFILKEIRIPTQEFMRTCRKDGRLKLQFIQSDDEIEDEDEDEEVDDHDDDDDDDSEIVEENEEGKKL